MANSTPTRGSTMEATSPEIVDTTSCFRKGFTFHRRKGSPADTPCSSTTVEPSLTERSQKEDLAAKGKKGRSKKRSNMEHVRALETAVQGSEVPSLVTTSEQLDTSVEELKKLLKALSAYREEEVAIEERRSKLKQVKQKEPNSVLSTEITTSRRALIQQYADSFGNFSSKIGDALKRTGDNIRTGFDKDEIVKTVGKTFGHMGQLHWAGFLLSGIAYVLSHLDLLKTNKVLFKKTVKSGISFGSAVVEAHKMVKNDDEHLIAILQEGVVFILHFTEKVIPEIHKNQPTKFLLGDNTKDLLEELEKEINRMFTKLTNAVTLKILQNSMNTNSTGDTEIPQYMSISVDEDEFDKIVPAIGIEDSLRVVKEMLKLSGGEQQDAKIGAVVMHGMGGIGKSTLGKRLYNQIAGKEFDEDMTCILDMSKPNTVETLQYELLLKFHKDHKEYKTASMNVMKARLVYSFKSLSKPVFIFLDNLEKGESLEMSLEKLLPDRIINHLPAGSRLLVASRSSDIKMTLEAIGIDPHQIEVFELGLLDKDSSRRLLRYHMLRDSDELPVRFIEYENQLLDACDGLPLALEVMARSLNGKEAREEAWRFVIEMLNKSLAPDGSRDDKLSKVLKVSYDQLDQICQQAFLDISFCFNQSSWSNLEILYGQRLEILRDRGLVKKEVKLFNDSGLRLQCVKVHSCFVALCRKIADNSGSHIRINGSNDSWNSKEVPQVLVLEGGCRGGYQIVEAAKLDEKLRSLRILLMTDVKFEGKCERVPDDLQCLYCHHSNVPFPLGNLKNLTLVDISSAADTEFKIPRGVRSLRLDAPSLEKLEFASEPKLEELGLMFCPRLQSDVEQTALSCLRKLVIRDGGCIKTLSRQRTRLLSVSIQSCPSFNLPRDLSGLRSLEHLHICGSRKLVDLPDLSGLENLTSLELEDCPLLEKLPEDMANSSRFRMLELKGCPRLESLPVSIDEEGNRDNADEHRAYMRREDAAMSSRWLKGLDNAEELKQKAIAAKYMTPLIHSRGTLYRLSNLVYELHSEEDPDVEIVFFPGISKTMDNREAHWRTWRRKDKEECWLQTLLPEDLNRQKIKARILSVSYESLLNNSLEPEELPGAVVRDLIRHPDSGVGQQHNVPVILVGHGLGGIVIKYFVKSVLEKLQSELEAEERNKLTNFRTNLKAFVFYSTPMSGSPAMEELAASIQENSPDKMLRFLKVLNREMAVLNQYIAEKRKLFNIRSFALCELNLTNEGDFHNVLVVPEGSVRMDSDSYLFVSDDHYGVAQAEDEYSPSVVFLADRVKEIVDESKSSSSQVMGRGGAIVNGLLTEPADLS